MITHELVLNWSDGIELTSDGLDPRHHEENRLYIAKRLREVESGRHASPLAHVALAALVRKYCDD